MATTISVPVSLNLSSDSQPYKRLPLILSPPFLQHPFLSLHKSCYFSSRFCSSSNGSSSSPTTTAETETPCASTAYDSYKTGRFLSNEEIEKLKALQDFRYYQQLETGSMLVRVMKPEEIDITVKLLTESFVESMSLPVGYVSLVCYFVQQYLIERRAAIPHAVTLIGFYKGKQETKGGEEEEDLEELAGTVEVCFDKRGASASPPTPTPPKNAPYICNMAVKQSHRREVGNISTKSLLPEFSDRITILGRTKLDLIYARGTSRRGIGWNLLKASEVLISEMSSMRDVYLHCRVIDSAPFNMYTKAGYNIVKTNSIWVLLMLQMRKHLMCKKLLVSKNPSELDTSGSDMELSSQMDTWKS
ncbi:ACYL-COA N-ACYLTRANSFERASES (NAT) SUPERFAMILY PROTEIN [Salix purpurea]|uniref:ACYL-COA N-ACYLTRANSFERASES (NAT) SUPERFAMILY PROTEIN n=1 Tax=Salix purpurea TaxID=77065 RepID=A0A9Q0TW76_SALPP|nr:ACYL-COA N-ACYLTRANSFERASES (NAT) SUPERFAMILY PROTEIN [Salix purpurea]